MQPLLLIDGDQFVFKATVAVEKEIRWDEQNHVLYANENEAYATLTGMLERIFTRFDSRNAALCFSQEPNFRKTVSPTYKGHRTTRKPMCYALMRERMEADFTCLSMPGLEADDVMGILATKPGPTKRIIVSQDKDMKTIPGEVWDGEDLIAVTPEEADKWHLYQTLIGDTSDGYPGCPGFGDVGASAFLREPYILTPYDHTLKSGKRKGEVEQRWKQEPLAGRSVWQGVVSIFESAGQTEAHALTQARLARILRWTDWDQENKAPILWTP